MAERFFFDGPLQLGPIALDGDEAHHLSHVSRRQVGETVSLFNGDGLCYRATIRAIHKREAELEVTEIIDASSSDTKRPRVRIASAIPKADRYDFLIEKLTELGVAEFQPLIATRSAVIPKEAKTQKRRRAVIEACKQCGRDDLMRVCEPVKLSDWLRSELSGDLWLADPNGEESPMVGEDVTVAIGPEGGFTVEESEAMRAMGFRPVRLGGHILRIETAAVVAAVMATNAVRGV